MSRVDMGLPLPCRLTPGTRARTGDWLAFAADDPSVLRVAVDGDAARLAGWAGEDLDAAACDRVDLDAMTGQVLAALDGAP